MVKAAGEITVAGKTNHETIVRGVVPNIGLESLIDDLSSVDSKGLNYQDWEVMFRVSIQSTQQQHNNYHSKQAMQQRERKEEKGQGEREKGRKDEGRRDQEGRRKEKEREPEVKKDVTDWIVVTRNKRQRKMIQIFVRVNGSKATPMEVNLTDDRVEDVMRRIQNDEDAYVTLHGRVLKRGEKLKSCEVTDGCTIQVTSRLRGGGRHKNKRSMTETKRNEDESGKKDHKMDR